MELWSPEHGKTLPAAVVVMLIVCAVLHRLLGNKSYRTRMIPFQIVTCIMLLLEVGKQGLSLYRGYDLYHLPFHFCSLFLFVYPVMAFYNGKHKNLVAAITASISTAVFLLLMIYPCLIYGAGNINAFFTDYFSFHTVAYHNLVIFQFILMLALGLYAPERKKAEVKTVNLFILCFCIVSSTMAQVLKTNYANYYSCNIPPLEAVRVQLQGVLGTVPTQILYILIVSALNLAFVYGAYWFYRLVQRLVCGLPKKEKSPTNV